MSTAKTSSKRAKKKAVRKPKTESPAPVTPPPRWPMEERAVDPDAPYFGLSKEEFERLATWRKAPRDPEMDRIIDWIIANHDRMRAETIEYHDGRPMKFIPYDGEPL